MSPYLTKNDNCYKYTLIVLMFNGKGVCLQHPTASTVWINKNEKLNEFDFRLEKPARAKHYLLCLELKGGKDGVSTDTMASRGMVLVEPRF